MGRNEAEAVLELSPIFCEVMNEPQKKEAVGYFIGAMDEVEQKIEKKDTKNLPN